MKAEGPGRQQCGDPDPGCHALFRQTRTPHASLIGPSHHSLQTFSFLDSFYHPFGTHSLFGMEIPR